MTTILTERYSPFSRSPAALRKRTVGGAWNHPGVRSSPRRRRARSGIQAGEKATDNTNERRDMTHLDDEILAEIVLVIDRVSWTELQDIETIHRGAVAYRGDDKTDDGPRWRLFVAGWSTGTPTRWRFDGTATRGELIVRLTPELAERAARKANPTRST